MRLVALIALVLAVGCTDGPGPSTDDDSADTDDCPDGTAAARDGGALVTNYIQNGLGFALIYDAAAELPSGQPAACISSDGKLAQWVLTINAAPAVVFRQSVTEHGSQTIDGATSSATLEIIGVDTVDANEWNSGTWFTDEDTDGTITSTIDAVAITSDGGNYTITASFRGAP